MLCFYFYIKDEEFGEHSVVVSLDGIQSEIILIDHPCGEMSVSCGILSHFLMKMTTKVQ